MCERGFGLIDQLIVAAGIVVLVGVLGMTIHAKGVNQGKLSERALWTAKEKKEDNATLLLLQKRIDDANVEVKKQQDLNKQVGTKYETELSQLRKERNADRALVRELGGLRLSASICTPDVGGTFTETKSGIGTDEASTGTIPLPQRVEENLWRITDEADEVSAQLRALQDWIVKQGFYVN